MHQLFSLTLAALLVSGCATGPANNEGPGPAAGATGLTPAPERTTDTRVRADIQTLDQAQLRLRKLNEAGVPQASYSLGKAQCWLDSARTQYVENDRTGYVEESLAESIKIIQALEADKMARAGFDTPLVARSSRVRDDLWAQFGQLKAQSHALACYGRSVACGEVSLVRAGHAEQQTGWRAAVPYVQMAEESILRARAEAANCPQPVAATPAVVMPSAAAPKAPAVKRETTTLETDTLFQYRKADLSDLPPASAKKFAMLAGRLKELGTIQAVRVVGHTDRIASDAYNLKLSQARADAVLAHLKSLGINPASAVAQGVGEREPVTTHCSDKLPRQALIDCLQPDRRVTIEVTAIQ